MEIFILDGEEDCALALCCAIEPSGHICRVFSSIGKALEQFRREEPDLVIICGEVPGVDRFLHEVQIIDPNVRIALDSDYYYEISTAGGFADSRYLRLSVDIFSVLELIRQIQTEVETKSS